MNINLVTRQHSQGQPFTQDSANSKSQATNATQKLQLVATFEDFTRLCKCSWHLRLDKLATSFTPVLSVYHCFLTFILTIIYLFFAMYPLCLGVSKYSLFYIEREKKKVFVQNTLYTISTYKPLLSQENKKWV